MFTYAYVDLELNTTVLLEMSQNAQLNIHQLLVSGKVTALQFLKFCDGFLEPLTVSCIIFVIRTQLSSHMKKLEFFEHC